MAIKKLMKIQFGSCKATNQFVNYINHDTHVHDITSITIIFNNYISL